MNLPEVALLEPKPPKPLDVLVVLLFEPKPPKPPEPNDILTDGNAVEAGRRAACWSKSSASDA